MKKSQTIKKSRSREKPSTSPNNNAIKEGTTASHRSITTFAKIGQYFDILPKKEISSTSSEKSVKSGYSPGIPLRLEILILALAVGVVYGHTLDVPFYLDDYGSILENPSLATWYDFKKIWQYAPLRVLGYFSFALNRAWNGLNAAGYHIVNILIHYLAGLSLFALAKGILKTPVLRDRISQPYLKWFPLITALFFLLHPLQTQAVTYVVQRLASLAGLFYLSAMALYLHGRLSKLKWPFFVVSFICALCAIFTKQNTITLPLAILLMELFFLRIQAKKLMQWLLIFIVTAGIGWFLLSGILGRNPFSLESMEALTRETSEISRIEYFATQTKVIWIYIRYFVFPTGLHLDHDIKILAGFSNEQAMLSILGHILVMIAAYLLAKKNPVISFGIFFYYLAHIVESSLIPIRDVLFEHRTYLPNAGLCLAAGWFFTSTLQTLINGKVAVWATASVLAALSVLTWQQNSIWRSPLALWSENARLAPGKYRVWDSLAQTLLDAGRNREAAEALNMGAELKNIIPGFVHWPSVISQITLLRRQGKYDEALSVADLYLQQNPNARVHSKILASKGNIYIERKDYLKAEQSFRDALEIYSDNVPAQTNLGIVLLHQGKREKAREIFLKVLKENPQQDAARKYLEILESSRPLKSD